MMETGREKVSEKQYAYWLCCIPGVGNQSIRKLLSVCGTFEEIYKASEKVWESVLYARQFQAMQQRKREWDVQGEYEKLQKKGICFWWIAEPEYPTRLKNIPDAPFGIFCKGKLPEENGRSVAIIGARECSAYGRFVAASLGKLLGEEGICVVSGMARGIDSISQEAALKAGGSSVAVLGNGVDICYPAQNKEVYELLLKNGAVLSAYPPGTLPKPQNFPPRNRIVSGLADIVVVVEARNKSGTLITVDMALEQGKEVYVVPGRITDRLSDGCNWLLKQGADVLLSPTDFLMEIQGMDKKSVEQQKIEQQKIEQQGMKLPPDLLSIYEAIDFYPKSIQEIGDTLREKGREWSGEVSELNTALMRLCLQNLVEQVSPGWFAKR